MFKRKREIKAIDLLKEANDYKRRKESINQKNTYDERTLNLKEFENSENNRYATKTLKTYITSYKDYDPIYKEIKKKKNKGRLDLGSHGNKDIFFEDDSDQYEQGNNSNMILKNRTNKCSKLLIDKVTPYMPDSYLTQNDINPYYSIKTYNNYNIRRPFNDFKRNKKNNNNKNIKNEIIPYKSLEYKKLNNFSSSNEIIKYPLVISLKNKNIIHPSQNSNLSNYFNEEADDYSINLSDNSKEEKNENKKEKKFSCNSYNDLNKEQIFIDKNSDIEQDYKELYLMKERQYNNLLKDYNNLLSKYKSNNYMINNFKKLNINKNNNNRMKKNLSKNNSNKNIKIINLNNIYLKGNQKIKQKYKLIKESFNINIPAKEIQFNFNENIKKINKEKENKSKDRKLNRKDLTNEMSDIRLIPKRNDKKKFDEKYLVINKIKDFKIILNNKKINSQQNSVINSNCNLKIDKNISLNLISFYFERNKKYINFNEIKEKKNGFLLTNNENGILNNNSIELNDVLEEIKLNKSTQIISNNNKNHINNEKTLTKIRNNKFNLNKFINKDNNKTKAEIIEKNIEDIINKNKYLLNNINLSNSNYSKYENNCENLPDISSLINRFHISVVKRNKINEDELN